MGAEGFTGKRSSQERMFLGATPRAIASCQTPFMRTTGHFLRKWRLHREMKQQEAADKIGLSRSHLSNIETGRKGYDQGFIEAAARVYRCSPADLIGRDPTAQEPIWNIVQAIPESERPRAARVLEAFRKAN